MSLSLLSLVAALAVQISSAPDALGQSRKLTAPESFSANAQVTGTEGAAATVVAMKVDRYSADADRDAVAKALTDGGYAAFLAALRQAPVVGTVTFGGQTFNIRWARQQPIANGRMITLVTDKPIFFVGGGNVNAKPREGFDVALFKFKMDDGGVGFDGTMAAAANVKAGGETGVQVGDYADAPITLRTITRAFN
jgi:hypothetical protein